MNVPQIHVSSDITTSRHSSEVPRIARTDFQRVPTVTKKLTVTLFGVGYKTYDRYKPLHHRKFSGPSKKNFTDSYIVFPEHGSSDRTLGLSHWDSRVGTASHWDSRVGTLALWLWLLRPVAARVRSGATW